MKTYRVIWEIEVDADSFLNAAQQALEIQRDPDSTALVFMVTETCSTLPVDLSEHGEQSD